MNNYTTFEVEASSFEGRIPLKHKFTIAAENKEEAHEAVNNRWPALYDIKIIGETK